MIFILITILAAVYLLINIIFLLTKNGVSDDEAED